MINRIIKLLVVILFLTKLSDIDAQSVADISGQIYKTVKIGDQTWMAQDLKVTKYNDGSDMPLVSNAAEWTKLSTPAYCWYENDQVKYGLIYGALYNWYAVSSTTNGGKNICPTGWHVPSQDEWTTLITFLGGESEAAGKMKESGTFHWITPNTDGNNSSGFTALPGGYREDDGTYYSLGHYGGWWSSTEYAKGYAWSRTIGYYVGPGSRFSGYKADGISVRCLRD